MTNYIVDREKLKEILLAHKTYISQRCQKLIAEGVDVSKLTYGETKKFTDEFIDTIDEIDTQILDFKDVYVNPDYKKDGYDWEIDIRGLKKFVPCIAKQLSYEDWSKMVNSAIKNQQDTLMIRNIMNT